MHFDDREAQTPPERGKPHSIEARLPLSSALVGNDETGNRAKAQCPQDLRRSVLRDDAALACIGGPRVIVDRLPFETRVWLDRRVWGLTNVDKVFLGEGLRAAQQYAESLFADLVERAASRVAYSTGRKPRNAAGREMDRMIRRGETQ